MTKQPRYNNTGISKCILDCIRLTKAMQTTAETMQLMADVHQSHITDGCQSWQDTIKDNATPSSTYAPLVDMHTGTHKKLVEVFEKEQTMEEIDSETVKSRCDTVFNITLAEMDRAHDERVQDFQKGTMEFLDSQIAYHEKVKFIIKPPNWCKAKKTTPSANHRGTCDHRCSLI